jgi:hypothetical protein
MATTSRIASAALSTRRELIFTFLKTNCSQTLAALGLTQTARFTPNYSRQPCAKQKRPGPAALAGADAKPLPIAAMLPVGLTFVAVCRDCLSAKIAEARLKS